MNQRILTVNAGSSSIKLDLFALKANDDVDKISSIAVSNIGFSGAVLTHWQGADKKQVYQIEAKDMTAAVGALLDWLDQTNLLSNITAIGHRIVHGGSKYIDPVAIDDSLVTFLEDNGNLDAEHIPGELLLIKALRYQYKDIVQVACFDTAYFADLPRTAQLLTLPRKLQESGMRRYGFHGLSYTYLDAAFRDIAGEDAGNGRVIYAHLGSGASLAAVHGGKPVDTTMSFTPTSGIIMSTRSGDVDPGLSWYLQKEHNINAEAYNHMVNFESGLLGVSGLSADMYTLLQHEGADQGAADAVNLFVHQVKKTIGAFTTVLGGLDSVIFAGGIGEQSAPIRSRICEGLDYLGLKIDSERNNQHESLISANDSTIGVHVVPTDESKVICRQVIAIIELTHKGGSL